MKSLAVLTNVPGDGACFYYALYQALAAQGPCLKQFCQRFNLRFSSEADFIQDLKRYLRDSDDYTHAYYTLFTLICQFLRTGDYDMIAELTSELPLSTIRLLKQYIPLKQKLTREERVKVCQNLQPFLTAIKRSMMQTSYWATEIETRLITEMLEASSCAIVILFAERLKLGNKNKRNLLLDRRANTIYLYNDGNHYQYFKFNPLAKRPKITGSRPSRSVRCQCKAQSTRHRCKRRTLYPPYCSQHLLCKK
jgi:hypothetical protein